MRFSIVFGICGASSPTSGPTYAAFWMRAPAPELDVPALVDAEEIPVELAEADVELELLEEIDFYDWLMLAQDSGDSA